MDFGISIDSPFLTYGVSYRQILMKTAPDGAPNHDAISLILGLTEDNFRIGYSYDITVSTLGWGITDGAHELTLSYVWKTPEPPANAAAPRAALCGILIAPASGLGQHVDLPLEVHTKPRPDVRLDVLRQGHEIPALGSPTVHQHERLPVVHPMRAPVVALPAGPVNEPACRHLGAVGRRVVRDIGMRRLQRREGVRVEDGVLEEAASVANHGRVGQLAPADPNDRIGDARGVGS